MQRPLTVVLPLALGAALAACSSSQAAHDAAPQDDAEGTHQDALQQDATGQADRDLSRCGTGTESCGTCHGTDSNPAPPPDLSGNTDPSVITVGAHQVHLAGGASFAPVDCSECHVVPTNVLDPGHCDSPGPAKVTFGPIATAKNTYPVWDRTTGTCQGTYCHGMTLQGGSTNNPSWTSTTPVDCGSCHAADYHGQTACTCHTSVWSNGQIIDPTKHVNGQVDM